MREKCKQCGECCKSEVCLIGLALFKTNELPCPALEFHGDDKYYCGLVLHMSQYVDLGEYADWKDEYFGKRFSEKLGIGKGCCSSFKN